MLGGSGSGRGGVHGLCRMHIVEQHAQRLAYKAEGDPKEEVARLLEGGALRVPPEKLGEWKHGHLRHHAHEGEWHPVRMQWESDDDLVQNG